MQFANLLYFYIKNTLNILKMLLKNGLLIIMPKKQRLILFVLENEIELTNAT